MRFVRGETDYELGVVPFRYFEREYALRGSGVKEQVLKLEIEEAARLDRLLRDNYLPENRVYRYNYFYDNCTSRARDRIEDALNGRVIYPPGVKGATFRSWVHQYTKNHPWTDFGISLCLGAEADTPINGRSQMFLPENLRQAMNHATVHGGGDAPVRKLVESEKDKLIQEDYFTPAIHDFLIKCVEGHCNIMVAGETGSGKTEFVKYLASHTKTNEKIITIEDTLELHLDKIFPERDIVAMKTNNVASYSDVLVTCMRQNPKWILLSEVRSAEAVSAVRNSISSGHNILSTIHADKASAIPYRLYSLMETDLDVHQFLTTIYRYIQLGVHIKAFYSKEYGKFHRELDEVAEFYVDDNNVPKSRIIYQKVMGHTMMCKPSAHLVEYLSNQNIDVLDIIKDLPEELPITDGHVDLETYNEMMKESGKAELAVQETVTTENTEQVVTTEAQPQEVVVAAVEPVVNEETVVQPEVVTSSENVVPDTLTLTKLSDEPIAQEAAPLISVVPEAQSQEAAIQVQPLDTQVVTPEVVQPVAPQVVTETVLPVVNPVAVPQAVPSVVPAVGAPV